MTSAKTYNSVSHASVKYLATNFNLTQKQKAAKTSEAASTLRILTTSPQRILLQVSFDTKISNSIGSIAHKFERTEKSEKML